MLPRLEDCRLTGHEQRISVDILAGSTVGRAKMRAITCPGTTVTPVISAAITSSTVALARAAV